MKHEIPSPTASGAIPSDPPLTARQAAAEAGITLCAFWRAVAAGRMPDPVYPLPRAPRWFATEIRAAMLALRMKPSDAKVARAAAARERTAA